VLPVVAGGGAEVEDAQELPEGRLVFGDRQDRPVPANEDDRERPVSDAELLGDVVHIVGEGIDIHDGDIPGDQIVPVGRDVQVETERPNVVTTPGVNDHHRLPVPVVAEVEGIRGDGGTANQKERDQRRGAQKISQHAAPYPPLRQDDKRDAPERWTTGAPLGNDDRMARVFTAAVVTVAFLFTTVSLPAQTIPLSLEVEGRAVIGAVDVAYYGPKVPRTHLYGLETVSERRYFEIAGDAEAAQHARTHRGVNIALSTLSILSFFSGLVLFGAADEVDLGLAGLPPGTEGRVLSIGLLGGSLVPSVLVMIRGNHWASLEYSYETMRQYNAGEAP
jgi:hypothetical protein